MKDSNIWMPIIERLIWPVFIVALLVIFREKVNGLYNMATEGRSLEIGGWLKIGEKVQNTDIVNFTSQDLSIEAIEGDEFAIEKGGERMLNDIQEKLRNSEIKSIDILKITNNKTYYRDMLLKYVSTLGIKQIVFIKDGKYDCWIGSSIFSGQLLAGNERFFRYEELKNFLAGTTTVNVAPDDKTSLVLEEMRRGGLDDVAVVEDGTFRSMVNRQDILTALVSSTLLSNQTPESK